MDDKHKNNFIYIVFAIIYLLIIIAIILILITAYSLKGKYDYGEGLKQQCTPLFLEKERGEHQLYIGYVTDSYEKFKNIYLTTLAVAIIVILLSYICANLVSGVYVITEIISEIWKASAEAGATSLSVKVSKPDITFRVAFGLFGEDLTTGIAVMFLLLLQGTILSVLLTLLVYWISGHFGKEKDKKDAHLTTMINFLKETPTKFSEKDKSAIIRKLHFYIHTIFILILLGCVIYNPVINDKPLISGEVIFNILAIYIIISIMMPLMTLIIMNFQETVSYNYHKYKDELNRAITDIFDSGDRPASYRILNEIAKNIANDEMDTRLGKDGTGVPPNLFVDKKYKEEGDLYKYLMHIINNYDVQNIQIPQELKLILNKMYLGGENTLELKKKLTDIYYRHAGGNLITQRDLRDNGEDVDLLPYLNANVRLLMVTSEPSDDIERDNYLNILNTYVISNTIFKKGNPLPENIIKIMSEQRQSTEMRDVINNYFYIINTIFTTFLIIFAYFVYHYFIYPNSLDNKLQVITIIACILLLVMGIFGWLFKDAWL